MNRRYRLFASSLALVLFLLLPALAAAADGRKVNINSADAAQLALLPRIGPSVAQRIVEHRKQNGAFKSAEDLMLVRGIGEKTFALIKPYVAIAGETTLKEKVKAGKAAAAKESGKDKDGGKEKEGAR